MDFIRFHLGRFFAFLRGILSAPARLLDAIRKGSARGQNLVRGLPAFIIGAAGIISVIWMTWGAQDRLVKSYQIEVDSIEEDRKTLVRLREESLVERASSQTNGALDSEKVAQMRESDPRTQEIEALDEKSRVFLKKLIEIDPENKDHHYQMAIRYAKAGNQPRCLSILEQIAPEDQPGHPKAHLQLAKYYEGLPGRNSLEKMYNIDKGLAHIKQCLTIDADNYQALQLKARLLQSKGSQVESREVVRKLFDVNPNYYRAMLSLAESDTEKASILENASRRYLDLLREDEVEANTVRWARALEGVFGTLSAQKEFDRLEELQKRELAKYQRNSDAAERVAFLRKMLGQTYMVWANDEIGSIGNINGESATESGNKKMLDFVSKAFSYDEKNRTALQALTMLGSSKFPEVAEGAKAIYDPSQSADLPYDVLSQLAIEALSKNEFKQSQKYFERARNLSPNNPGVLNNLAFAYLQEDAARDDLPAETRKANASRAHRLIEQAIRLLPEAQKASPIMSSYRHTLGTALMQLENYPAAAAQFELALATRKEDPEVLKSIIECYAKFGLDSRPFQQQLKRAEEKTNQNSDTR